VQDGKTFQIKNGVKNKGNFRKDESYLPFSISELAAPEINVFDCQID